MIMYRDGKQISKHMFYFKDVELAIDAFRKLERDLEYEAGIGDEQAELELERTRDLIKDLHYILMHQNDGSQIEISIEKN